MPRMADSVITGHVLLEIHSKMEWHFYILSCDLSSNLLDNNYDQLQKCFLKNK